MFEDDQPPAAPQGRGLFTTMGVAIAVAVIVTFSAGGAVLLARRSSLDSALIRPSSSATAAIAVTRDLDLRASPAADAALVTHIADGTRVRVLGRSPDARWLVVGIEGASSIVGWAPVDALTGYGDVQRLAIVADARSVSAGGTRASSTQTPDLADLRIDRVYARQDRLVVSVVNDGPGDLTTPIFVSVNDGAPVRLETKAGEPLRAREGVEMTVAGAYVQLRAPVTAKVFTQPPEREEDTSNNTWTGLVEPDVPNDLEILRAAAAGGNRQLVVTVRNASSIPIAGTITLTAREALPSTTLLGRVTQDVNLEPGATVDVPVTGVVGVDLTRATVRLSTDAINDANLSNDTYPR